MARIAFFLPNFGAGGAEKVVLALVRHLSAEGHDIDLLLVRREGQLLQELPVVVRVIELGGSNVRRAFIPLCRYLRRARPDALHVRMWPLPVLAILANRLMGSASRVTLAEDAVLSRQYGFSGHQSWLMRSTMRLTYRSASGRVAVSRGSARDLSILSGVPLQLITVIHNPIAGLGSDGPAQPELWKGSGSRLLAVGNLKPVKNFSLLLQAFAVLLASRDAQLLILGEGEQRSDLEALAIELGVADRVSMPGHMADPGPAYRAADLFVCSSDHEGFGNVLVEALGHGLKIVSTNCPHGPLEILDGGRYGELVPPGSADALAKAMNQCLDRPYDPVELRRRAKELSGNASILAYERLILGPET